MTIEEGYARFACDRIGAHDETFVEYLGPHDKRRDEWHELDWLDKNGVQMHSLLCPVCAQAYRKIQQAYVSDVQSFMNERI